MSRTRILLVSRSHSVAAAIEQQLRDSPHLKLVTKIVSNGHVDPLQDVTVTPDILLLHCASEHGELQYLADTPAHDRPVLVVIGPEHQANVMRLAMRAGASDYLASPLTADDLVNALERLSTQIVRDDSHAGDLVTVVNSHGGSGASFLAANLAYGFHTVDKIKTLLVDFDLQFGGLCRYFDMKPTQGLMDALESVEDLDEVSCESYITRHRSGLRLLATKAECLRIADDVTVPKLDMLFRMLLQHNKMVVVDLPRRIDLLSATLLESSDHILLVVQQTLSHLHDAMRMVRIITEELRIPQTRLTIVVNRHDKNSLIEVKDISEALKVDQILKIPNHYELVADSINVGEPLIDRAKHSGVVKSIGHLRCHIRGIAPERDSSNILQRAIPALLRRTQ